MRLKVITPDTTLFDGHIKSINVAEPAGTFSILKGHAPLITVVKNVISTILTETDELTYIAASSGVLKVLNHEVSFIVDDGAVGTSKASAKTNLENLKKEIEEKGGSLGDDQIARLEVELMRSVQQLGQ